MFSHDESKVFDKNPRYSVDIHGNVWDHKLAKQLNLLNSRGGYKSVILMYNGQSQRQKKWFIHRLVALCFIPNPDNLPNIDHINRVGDYNHKDNLRWSRHSPNEANRPGWVKRPQLPKNVYRCRDKYRVQIMKDRVAHHCGVYPTVEEAELVAVLNRIRLFGCFAYIN